MGGCRNSSTKLPQTRGKGKDRKEILLKCYTRAESNSVDGGRDESREDYCSGDARCHRDRMKRMCRIYFCLYLKNAIQRRLPNRFFSERGYTRTLLHLSPWDIAKHCTFLIPAYLNANHGDDSSIAIKVKDSIM